MRCREDLRGARTAARHRVAKPLLRHGLVYREGKRAWTKRHGAWVARQRLQDPLAQLALEQLLIHLEGIERQLTALDARLHVIAGGHPLGVAGRTPASVPRISTVTALGLIAEIGDFARFGHPARARVLARDRPPANTAPATSSHRGHITKAGNRHARRLLSKPPGTTSHAPRQPLAAVHRPVPPASPTAPGTPRCACTTATNTSTSATNAPP